ncbi:nuclear transport factor 2 family protein [Maribacter sp. BPC-D8]|uniref:YybH family protein n=1 Tax=Maribacter sp. BPC-D8 TaxID=3053613 RepID=UPI002B460196|nr:nuclear transport factor 2 family protein [Maribacter sp. BPC-D8]WRI30551.1 nuclear transport factor 2 family protein [Maribacter sp. BPC-D8]
MNTIKNNLRKLLAIITIMLIAISCGTKITKNTKNVGKQAHNIEAGQVINYAPATTPKEVAKNLETYLNTKDIKGVLSLYNEESVFVNQPEGIPLIGLDAIRNGFQSVLDMGGQSDIQVRNVIQSGNLALLIVDWVTTGIDAKGKAFEFKATATDVVQQNEAGHWLYKIDNAFGVAHADSPIDQKSLAKKVQNIDIAAKLELYMNTKNMNGILSLYNEESVFVNKPEGEPKAGLESIREGFQGYLNLGGQSDIKVRNLIQSGNVALVIVDWTFKGTDSEGNAFKFGATATDVLKRNEAGIWQYRIDNAFGVKRAN